MPFQAAGGAGAAVAITLTKNNEAYQAGRYSSLNGVWNQGALINGRDYTQTITIEPSTFPNGVTMNWSWPLEGNGSVYSYPEISYSVAGDAVRLNDIITLNASYDFRIGGDPSGFNVAFEAWFYPDTRGIWETSTSEVMLWVHSNGWKPPFNETFTDQFLAADVFIDPNWGDASGSTDRKWQYVTAINRQDKLSGEISYSNLLKDLIWKGVLTGYEYIRSVEVGAEVMHGAGSLHVAHLDYTEVRKTPVHGTAGDDLIAAKPVGQNHVLAGPGTDTVVYEGRFADYEVQPRALDVLVRGARDLSTLDMLESVEKIRFSDGVFDVASRSFTGPAGAAPAGASPTMDGTAGPDVLIGGPGRDVIRGLDGADSINGGAGDDELNGNMGDDTVFGGDGADTVLGGQGNDQLNGNAGADFVNGNLGQDTVRGGAGNDTVHGGQGNDLIFGDAGNDWLSGDLGSDTLYGGPGADRFLFAKGGGVDWVADFNSAEGDRVQLPFGTAFVIVIQDGQVVIDLGGGDRLGLAGVPMSSLGDWLVLV